MTDTSNPGIGWGGRSCGVRGHRCCQAPRRCLASTPVAGESAGSKTRRSKTQRASPQARPRNAAAFVATSDSRKITRCTSRYLLRVAGILAKQPAGGDARGSIDIENEERPKSTQAAEHTYGGGVHSSAAVCTTSQTETRANSKNRFNFGRSLFDECFDIQERVVAANGVAGRSQNANTGIIDGIAVDRVSTRNRENRKRRSRDLIVLHVVSCTEHRDADITHRYILRGRRQGVVVGVHR